MPVLNAYQIAAAKSYGGGDFAHIADVATEEEFKQELDGVGDTMFRFLMIELSDKEDCENLETAIDRIRTSVRELEDVIEALEKIEPAAAPGV